MELGDCVVADLDSRGVLGVLVWLCGRGRGWFKTYALGGERLRGRDARVELGVLLGEGFGVGRHYVG